MSKGQPEASPSDKKRGAFTRFLDTVEYLGNLLPHPVTLFALFCLVVIVASGIAAFFGLNVADPRPATEGEIIGVNSLMSGEGLRYIVSNLVPNFTGFPPLGVVLVAILGVGIAERSGMLSAMMRGMVMNASPRMVTVTIVFAGVVSNTASELGYVVLVPLAAMIFHSLGRHPLAGLAAAFAGVSAGYSANLFIGTVDPLLSGFTTSAAQLIDPDYVVGPEMNWYFMFISTFLVAGLGAFVTEKIVEPKLGKYNPGDMDPNAEIDENVKMEKLSKLEKKGLIYAGLTFFGLLVLLALTIIPEAGVLRNQETGGVAGSPFLNGIVVFIFVTFAIPGLVYGYVTRVLRSDRDVIDAMAASMSSMGLYIVLVFFAAQFVAFFGWTNFGTIMAVNGASLLESINLTGPLVFVVFILMCAFVNLMLGSASAQWAVTAPIFVPMLMLVGYAPELVQAAYRIGDSVTNIITPMMSYFGLILAVAARYQKNLGIGTLIAIMLPYSMVFLAGWIVLFYLWVFILGMPVGPGAATYYSIGG
ncbi:aminobenzoyl-glutamate transporter [Aliidiomarina minuta]|uniref:Aminobenzoyl-glutamate transporter n=1 Tax=Aliidiomarina minuta TaxID=880057 RepID=A0A432W9I1_9GAMM|nr:AbgT family transporter [Aliidiomarina minuta]RUO26711.1 aminobenzoyl-glutamate transporter [Aliidiomarina minuta]